MPFERKLVEQSVLMDLPLPHHRLPLSRRVFRKLGDNTATATAFFNTIMEKPPFPACRCRTHRHYALPGQLKKRTSRKCARAQPFALFDGAWYMVRFRVRREDTAKNRNPASRQDPAAKSSFIVKPQSQFLNDRREIRKWVTIRFCSFSRLTSSSQSLLAWVHTRQPEAGRLW
jgi:hypothetical protein